MNKRTKAQRSYNMSRIRSRDTSIEKILRRALRINKLHFRCNNKAIFGKPDFIIHKKKIAIFCDSAFWHGYKFGRTKIHKFRTRKNFWEQKILGNIKRDKLVNSKLTSGGWKVIRFWDFDLKKDVVKCADRVKDCVRRNRGIFR